MSKTTEPNSLPVHEEGSATANADHITPPTVPDAPPEEEPERRGFLAAVASWWMGLGLLGGYGTFATIAGRFLYPAKPQPKSWLFVAELERLRQGDSLVYTLPNGQTVNVARVTGEAQATSFIALSSVCPHLGCRVHWEGNNNRFFCPCHNGAFDSVGNPTEGPPRDANQTLARFPLKVENGLLFMEVTLG